MLYSTNRAILAIRAKTIFPDGENCHFKRQKKKGELGTLVLLTDESLTLITVPAICHYVCLQLMRTATKY